MSFKDAFKKESGGGLGAAFGTAVGGIPGAVLGTGIDVGINKLFGESSGSRKRRARKQVQAAYDTSRNLAEYGAQLDLGNQKKMLDFRVMRGLEAGLTPHEVWGAGVGAAGGGSGSTGGTLGNGGQQAIAAAAQQQNQDRIAQREGMANRKTQLLQTAMQTEAQKYAADRQAGATERGQDINERIADNIFSLNQRELNEIKIPQAAEQLNLTKQQVQTEINRTATSSERFQTAMKQLSMGPANLLVELTMRHHGISLADDSFTKLSESQRKKILDELIAMASTAFIEGKGTAALGKDSVNTSVGDTIADWIANLITHVQYGVKPGIEATPGASKVLGKGARMSEAFRAGPDMNVR